MVAVVALGLEAIAPVLAPGIEVLDVVLVSELYDCVYSEAVTFRRADLGVSLA